MVVAMSRAALRAELERVKRDLDAKYEVAAVALRNYEREPTAERLAVFEDARRALVVPGWLSSAILEATT